jgi:putative transposase
MLNEDELKDYCSRLGLKENAFDFIKRMREEAPARRAQSQRSVRSIWPSRKMPGTIQSESRTNELGAIYVMEHDPKVLEFWDQPCKVRLTYELESGRKYTGWHTPDFFVMELAACGYLECKLEEDLEKEPELYRKNEDGVWICPPGEAMAAQYGFFFRVGTPPPGHLVTNIAFLMPFFFESPVIVRESVRRSIRKILSETQSLPLSDLKTKCSEATMDELNTLIARGAMYIDLSAAPLTAPDRCRVFRDSAMAAALRILESKPLAANGLSECPLFEGLELQWGVSRWKLAVLCEQEAILHGEGPDRALHPQTIREFIGKGEMVPLNAPVQEDQRMLEIRAFLDGCSEEAIERGLRRAAMVQDPALRKQLPARTIERYRSQMRLAAARYGGEDLGWLGLIPCHFRSGRKPLNLPSNVQEILEVTFQSYETPSAISGKAFWGLVLGHATTKGIVHMCCEKTALKWLAKRKTQKTLLVREGAKVANAKAPPCKIREGWEPGGRWPWDCAYIDHTKADVELRLEGGRKTRRVWLSVMLDGFSRKVLAYHFDFVAPRREALMHLIRECVRRHSRLPSTLVLDGGSEFQSVYFEKLMAAYRVKLDFRPTGKPRFGAQIERWFSTANTKVLHQLLGNTKAMKQVREVTKAIDPRLTAVWTITLLDEGFSEFCYSLYNTAKHKSLGCSPNEKYATGLEAFGNQHGVAVPNRRVFYLASMLSPRTGTSTVTRQGIGLFGFNYYHPTMNSHIGEQVPVRYDPYDISSVLVYLGKKWKPATCGISAQLRGMSERQRELMGKMLREEQRQANLREDVSERAMGVFLLTMKAKEALLEQKLLEDGTKAIRERERRELLALGDAPPSDSSQEMAPPQVVPASFLKNPTTLKTYNRSI